MPRKAKETKPGRVSIQDHMTLVNKKAGRNVAHDLTGENPTEVKDWIPTGSRWLDSIICKGQLAGIPVGKVTEIAGLTSTGKSYMAAQIAATAQKQGKLVVYFDSESAIDPAFLEAAAVFRKFINQQKKMQIELRGIKSKYEALVEIIDKLILRNEKDKK